MTDAEYRRKLDELDQLLNDPDVPMQPDRIWSILADVSRRDLPQWGEPDPDQVTRRSSQGRDMARA